METSERYKTYIIDYYSISGDTIIRNNAGFDVKWFLGMGESRGKKEAKKYIDNLS